VEDNDAVPSDVGPQPDDITSDLEMLPKVITSLLLAYYHCYRGLIEKKLHAVYLKLHKPPL